MGTVGVAPGVPSTHCPSPLAVMLTPLARSPSCIGELVNCASQPTLSLSIWQRVWPDLVSMNTWPLLSGGSGIAPAGGLALGGAGRDGAAEGIDGLAFGKVGSVGPAPDDETAFPWMSELHPLTRAALNSRPASSRPPVPVVLNPCRNIASQGYAGAGRSGGSDAPRSCFTGHSGCTQPSRRRKAARRHRAPALRRHADQALALVEHRVTVLVPVGVLAGDRAVIVDERFDRLRYVDHFGVPVDLHVGAVELVGEHDHACLRSAPDVGALGALGIARDHHPALFVDAAGHGRALQRAVRPKGGQHHPVSRPDEIE